MLFPKPYYLKKRHEARNQGRAYAALVGDGEESEEAEEAGGGGGDFDYGEVLVHQMIHTIEFVLGAVSNTASYLRLWALSLAHAQLSAVFWDRVFMGAVATGSPVAMVVGFAVWAAATIGVLMLMENPSSKIKKKARRDGYEKDSTERDETRGGPARPTSNKGGDGGCSGRVHQSYHKKHACYA
jgi:V-type H+-transporting ATPase subunit a